MTRALRAYTNTFDHVRAELERLDLLLHHHVDRSPAETAKSAESAESVQTRLDRMAAENAERTHESLRQGVELRLLRLADLFDLTTFDLDVVLAALAPEIDRRYERLYGDLHDDDDGRRRPTVGLVLELLCPDLAARVALRARFAATAPLLRHHIVGWVDGTGPRSASAAPSLSDRVLHVDPRVVAYLLGHDEIDDRLRPLAEIVTPSIALAALVFPAPFAEQLDRLAEHAASPGGRDLVLYCQGEAGGGRRSVAEALCLRRGARLLVVRTPRLADRHPDDLATLAALVGREARLQGAHVLWEDVDVLLAEDKADHLAGVVSAIEDQPGPSFLTGRTPWQPSDALHGLAFVRLELPRPGYGERLELWRAALDGDAPGGLGPDVDLPALAGKFRLSGGRIGDAAATARNLALARDPRSPMVTQDDLHTACRLHSNRKLAELAQKVTSRSTWDDIVLPPAQLEQLREIHDQVEHRAVVHEAWGFGRKLALGKGLNVLFAGPPGTGKTMAADVLAHTLGLDLYKIDLASVVSKYIGETEKNLARIFDEATTSNAILFFDEADALFGQRTQVRDAHDRYANIETSYLLQRMEEYEGVVVLATNLRKNMDEAFVRRLHVAVDFPMPGVDDRRRIWAQVWPDPTPRDPGLDLELLAREVDVAGGAIRNIAVAGAFLAAADGGVVTMAHLEHATRREYQKMGKVLTSLDPRGAR